MSLKTFWSTASGRRAGGVSPPTARAPLGAWQTCYFRARMCSESLPASEYPAAQNPTLLEHHRPRTSRGLPSHTASRSRDSLNMALPRKNTQPGSEPLRFPTTRCFFCCWLPQTCPPPSAKPQCQTRLGGSGTLM